MFDDRCSKVSRTAAAVPGGCGGAPSFGALDGTALLRRILRISMALNLPITTAILRRSHNAKMHALNNEFSVYTESWHRVHLIDRSIDRSIDTTLLSCLVHNRWPCTHLLIASFRQLLFGRITCHKNQMDLRPQKRKCRYGYLLAKNSSHWAAAPARSQRPRAFSSSMACRSLKISSQHWLIIHAFVDRMLYRLLGKETQYTHLLLNTPRTFWIPNTK